VAERRVVAAQTSLVAVGREIFKQSLTPCDERCF